MGKIRSINPATGELLAEVESAGEEQVHEAVGRARSAFPSWSQLSFRERGRHILAVREVICRRMDEIARLITRENGKPLVESLTSDLFPTMDFATYFAKNTGRLLKSEKIWLGKWFFLGRTSVVEYRPLGVVGILAPGNYPFAIPSEQAIMALMAGNTVVLKPSESTPLIGRKIGQVFEEAGLPPGVLQVLQGDGATGAALVTSGVNKVLFTGSTETGKKIMELAARTLTSVELEMGGKDPMIVLEDADLELAASAAVWGAFHNAGQACSSVERLYVHEKIANPFLEVMRGKTVRLRVGPGSGPEVELGPLSSGAQLRKVKRQVAEARKGGAKVIVGGAKEPDQRGWFFPPTILQGVDHSMEVMREETFGPVIGVMTFKDEEEAVRLANDSRYGLTASIWTKNLKQARELARKIEAGTVMINENVYAYALPQTPWGGPKESSLGRTHGRLGLLELVEPRHIHVNHLPWLRDLWWYRYSPARYKLFLNLSQVLFGRGIFSRAWAVVKLIWYRLKIKNL